ncbi:unnamed protein product [Fraxinus pennsylvanica]|uniref:Uncharacterized protein n=1 Tax=Fraxinus pennsylvanica TaxID=56036 RepID=A0AAD2A2C4_9LAMI|nr:unnamed protein product [Fraxinus pennsylvanica]
MVQQWPKAFCDLKNRKCLRTPNNFTLHGLWPDNYIGQLSNCAGAAFHAITDQNLISRLESGWPDLLQLNYKGARGQSFWKHEWVEHGTCSTTPKDYEAYFNLAVDLKNEHYILRTLRQSGIQPAVCTPSGQSTVNIYGVNSSIVGATRSQIQIRCKINKQNKKKPRTLLYEIIICYDSTGTTVINCPPPHIGQTCLQNSGQVDFL